jgi:Zn-dependent M28 family amino/carboxypeptidase
MKIWTRKAGIRAGIFAGLCLVLSILGWACMIRMPGRSYSGDLPPLSEKERELSSRLRSDVEHLALKIGVRNLYSIEALDQSAEWIEGRFKESGLTPRRLTYQANSKSYHNIEAAVAGGEEILVIGAHYDSAYGSPAANDNGTGVAALLALAGSWAGRKPARTLRFVAFVNEEPPFFQTDQMGSRVYARECKARGDRIVGMLSLETMGCYKDSEGTQNYPPPLSLFYPSRGDFIAFVGNTSSGGWTREVIGLFRKHASFPSEGAALPGWLPGVGWSDQWSFWEEGYSAAMVTDTAPFRYEHYHSPEDTPDKVDFDRLARVVSGLAAVLEELALK